MIPMESATSRDILEIFFPKHALHSMDGAVVSGDIVGLECSCGKGFSFSEADAKKAGLKFVDIVSRLRKLGQIGRQKK